MHIPHTARRVGSVDFLTLKLCTTVVICEWKEDKKTKLWLLIQKQNQKAE